MDSVRPLKRNEACHHCRKRKLKCDARRPCTSCLRTHGHLVDNAPVGAVLPPYPDCVYDQPEPARNDSKKLEDKIGELESQLERMKIELVVAQAQTFSGSHSSDSASQSTPSQGTVDEFISTDIFKRQTNFAVFDDGVIISNHLAQGKQSMPVPWSSTDQSNVLSASTLGSHDEQVKKLASGMPAVTTPSGPSYEDSEGLNVTFRGWPLYLPDPVTTRHLVAAFFLFHTHAHRLFHAPTFIASLDLHPSDPGFPPVAVLHALCAVGSMFTAEISPTPVHTDSVFPYTIFQGRWRRIAQRPDSFAEQQAKLASQAVDLYLDTGDNHVPALQAKVLLTMFYMSQALWAEAYLQCGHTLRSMVPCGMSTASPFKIPPSDQTGPIIQEAAILPPAQSVIEEELRRNIFWIGYALERQQALSRDFALELDDQDIVQLLPVTREDFIHGISVPLEKRQWSTDSDVLLRHDPEHTDSFVLYIKSTMLISRVKTFNVRFKSRFISGDPDLQSPLIPPTAIDDVGKLDPRDTPAFQALDYLTNSFRSFFPPRFRKPLAEDTLDQYLYSTHMAAYLSIISLHDQHANMDDSKCRSVARILQAARAILELMYILGSTSHDLSLVDHLTIMGWYFCGRVLIRFLHKAIKMNSHEHVETLRGEINDILIMLGKVGECIAVAYRYKRILRDVIAQTCGEQYLQAQSQQSSSPLSIGYFSSAYITPVDAAYVDDPPPTSNVDNISL
ncbi:hypothetical protein BDW22DRAFT_1363864 [Trametopsis cervina]|nr:hypothetical protein BDW22DRAFT_1363864 [Trametopsis cervina]